MSNKAIQALVVTGAAGLFVGGTLLGVNLAFSEPEPVAEAPPCEVRTIQQGEVLSSNLVMVHVYNASRRAGIANRAKINLERRGFLGGVAENNPGQVKAKRVTILTDDPEDPRVRLVARQFKGKVVFAAPDFTTEDGVSVLIGPEYNGLRKAGTKVEASRDVSVCVPTITLP